MLAITTSDAIALGSMIAALTAACVGLVRGDQANGERSARRASAEEASDRLDDLTEAVRALADVLRAVVLLADSQRPLLRPVSDVLHRNNEH